MDSFFKTIKNATTVLELAVYLEEEGIKFYKKHQQAVKDETLKSVFQFLADEEAEHRETFIHLLENSGGDHLELKNLVGEYGMYMDLLVKEAVLLLNIEKSGSVEEILQSAIRFEKETLLFYYEIYGLVDEGDKEPIMQICEQEKQHIIRLASLRH